MITDLWIENFKGISKRQHIPLRPVTLLFGANSAGKSTVLHALLYLRELICNQNINPTNAIAGSNTVNLGGVDNLLHVKSSSIYDDRNASAFTIGCRFSLPAGIAELDPRWAFRMYSADTASSGYWDDPDVGDSYMNVGTDEFKVENIFSDQLPDRFDFKFEVSVGQSLDGSQVPEIRQVNIQLEESPFVSGWFNPQKQNFCWWLNIWHDYLLPVPSEDCESAANHVYHTRRIRKKAAVFLRVGKAFQVESNVENHRVDIHPLMRNGGQYVRNVLGCPSPPVWIGLKPSWIPDQGEYAKAGESEEKIINRSMFIRLEDFLEQLNFNLEQYGVSESVEGVVVGLNLTAQIVESEGIATPVELISIFVCKHATCSLSTAVDLLRLACMTEAGAGAFYFLRTDENGLPLGASNCIFGSDLTRQFPGMSLLGPSHLEATLFDLYRARIDQYLSCVMARMQTELKEVCYLGPKRSTVPRNLNSDVIDDFRNWGDGIGAWTWLLNESQGTDKCSEWVSSDTPGLNLGFKIETHEYVEISSETLAIIRSRIDVEEVFGRHERILQQYSDKHPNRRKLLLRDIRSGAIRHPQDMGEGVTQVVPVVACLVRASAEGSSEQARLFAIEQPELHLHPAVAARLGDLIIVSAFPIHDSTLLIETHSEHLILRILRRIRQTTDNELPEHIPPVKPDDVCVLWVDNLGDGTTVQRLRIDERGEFIDRWPRGFFSERAEELF